MTDGVTRGRLAGADDVPAQGERVDVLVAHVTSGTTVEHLLTGEVATPIAYRQPHPEWVLVLEGAATLEVDGIELPPLTTGDWVLVPADAPHRVLAVEAGTRWLAVHLGQVLPRS